MADPDLAATVHAFVRISGALLEGISTFAVRLAGEGRLSADEIEELSHRLVPPASPDDSPAFSDLRERYEFAVGQVLGSAAAAAAKARDPD